MNIYRHLIPSVYTYIHTYIPVSRVRNIPSYDCISSWQRSGPPPIFVRRDTRSREKVVILPAHMQSALALGREEIKSRRGEGTDGRARHGATEFFEISKNTLDPVLERRSAKGREGEGAARRPRGAT